VFELGSYFHRIIFDIVDKIVQVFKRTRPLNQSITPTARVDWLDRVCASLQLAEQMFMPFA
jgi:hypothetical protein